MNFTCKKCGHTAYELKPKGTATGLYCAQCGFWHKWVSKNDLSTYKAMASPAGQSNGLPEELIINGVKFKKEI